MKKENKNNQDFVHLHVHSHYSLLDGLGKIDDLVARAKEFNMGSLALTDHGVMYGAIEFYQKATAAGIKPIIGCEMYLTNNGMENKRYGIDDQRYHLLLLAENLTGYKNLLRLVTDAHLRGFYYKPRVDKEFLRQHSEGLIATSACMGGEIPKAIQAGNEKNILKVLQEYQDIFGKANFFLELEHHENSPEQQKVNAALIALAKKTGAPLVATCDVHYVSPEDKAVQDVLLCIQQNKKVEDTNRLKMTDFNLYLKSQEEMWEHFKDTPEALTNTVAIAERCGLEIPMGQTVLPHFAIPQGEDEIEYLREQCLAGLKNRFPAMTPAIQERLDFELGVVGKMGYASYFLIVADFVNWAKENGIVVGPGRGSAAGSLISYLMNITDVDPLRFELLFERFLNPDRVSMPDIDIDFADNRRDEVIQYVAGKYGADHVAQIITFGTMAARAAIRDAGRALNYPYDLCDRLAKEIPAFTKLKDALEKAPELKKLYDSDSGAKQILDMASRLEGVVRHASTHACGVVITKEPLVEYLPVQRNFSASKKEEAIVTQFEGKTVEALGLLKMDFLGLKNLTILQNVLDIIRAKYNEEPKLSTLPLDDKKTLNLFAKGDTTGVFQFESAGFKRYLRELKPTRFQDLIDMVALYRPGPMEWIPQYISGKNGTRPITYLHPKLEPILKKTYGIIVVQEQVMEISKQLAGFTAGEADYLRKAMGKKIKELMDEQEKKFIQGCNLNAIDEKTAKQIWEFIKPFAGYGFNWAHSACYALIGYQTAYFKAHYPVPFMAALLSSDEDNTDRIAIEVEECRQMGIEVKPPDINESFGRFAAMGEGKSQFIRYGLNAVKNVGHHIAEVIVKARKEGGPFKDILDFIERVADKDLNKKSLEALAKCGALESIIRREQVLENLDKILAFIKELKAIKDKGQCFLFCAAGEEAGLSEAEKRAFIDSLKTETVIDKKQNLLWEKELLGVYMSENPLEDYLPFLEKETVPLGIINPPPPGDLDEELVADEPGPEGNDESLTTTAIPTNAIDPESPPELPTEISAEKPALNYDLNNPRGLKVGGMITRAKKIYTKNNQEMVFVELEDLTGKLELIVFPNVYKKFPDLWQTDKIIWARGKKSEKDDSAKLLVNDAGEITPEQIKKASNKKKGNPFAKPGPADSPQSGSSSSGSGSATPPPPSSTLKIEFDPQKGDSKTLKSLITGLYSGTGKIVLNVLDANKPVTSVRIAGNFNFSGRPFDLLEDYLKSADLNYSQN